MRRNLRESSNSYKMNLTDEVNIRFEKENNETVNIFFYNEDANEDVIEFVFDSNSVDVEDEDEVASWLCSIVKDIIVANIQVYTEDDYNHFGQDICRLIASLSRALADLIRNPYEFTSYIAELLDI